MEKALNFQIKIYLDQNRKADFNGLSYGRYSLTGYEPAMLSSNNASISSAPQTLLCFFVSARYDSFDNATYYGKSNELQRAQINKVQLGVR